LFHSREKIFAKNKQGFHLEINPIQKEEVMEFNNTTDQIYCHKQAKNVSRESCRRCESYNPADYFDLFNRCSLEEQRFEALYRVYKRSRSTSAKEIS
jgi:hypothetical protein